MKKPLIDAGIAMPAVVRNLCLCVLPSIAAGLVGGCGGGGGNSSNSAAGFINSPSTVNAATSVAVYPAGSANSNSSRIFMPVTAVGTQMLPSALPLILDSGSAGITMYAQAIFPSSMVSSSGFVFPTGATSIQYNGITVTNVQGTKSFSGTQQTGNLGFATVTFGANSELTTASVPIFFYFSILNTFTSPPTPVTTLPSYQGIFGINTAGNAIVVSGNGAPTLSICNLQSTSTCHQVSPLRYLSYGAGINTGFMLSPATLQPTCDISTWNGCTQANIFTVGLTDSSESGFASEQLTCPGNQPSGSSNGISVCQPAQFSTISDITTSQSFSMPVAFDTGTPHNSISVPAASSASFPATIAAGTGISIATASGFNFNYTAGAPSTTSYTQITQNTSFASIIGIDFFTNHSFFVDFTTSKEGFQ